MAVTYGPKSITATTASGAQTIYPLTGEPVTSSVGIIDIYNAGASDVYINVSGLHDPNSFYAIAGGQAKQFQSVGNRGFAQIVVKAYAASAVNVYVMPMSQAGAK